MPYKLRKAPKKELYWVTEIGTSKKFSKLPIPLNKAKAQMRVLEAALKGGVHVPPGMHNPSDEGEYDLEDEVERSINPPARELQPRAVRHPRPDDEPEGHQGPPSAKMARTSGRSGRGKKGGMMPGSVSGNPKDGPTREVLNPISRRTLDPSVPRRILDASAPRRIFVPESEPVPTVLETVKDCLKCKKSNRGSGKEEEEELRAYLASLTPEQINRKIYGEPKERESRMIRHLNVVDWKPDSIRGDMRHTYFPFPNNLRGPNYPTPEIASPKLKKRSIKEEAREMAERLREMVVTGKYPQLEGDVRRGEPSAARPYGFEAVNLDPLRRIYNSGTGRSKKCSKCKKFKV